MVAVPALCGPAHARTQQANGLTTGLFHALALILVFGIGDRLQLVFASAQNHGKAVMMAVFMSACSTLLAFGLLAFSQTQRFTTLVLTLSLGIGFTFLLSPLILKPQHWL